MNINLTRGDTETIKVTFQKNNENYVPNIVENGDLLTFTVRDNYSDVIVFSKKIEFPDASFKITHEDTKYLKFGSYDFDIEFSKVDKSVVKTLVVGKFNIQKEVTF